MDASAIEEKLPAALPAIVRRALEGDVAGVSGWECKPAGASRGAATGGVYLVSGTARVGASDEAWRLVLKILSPAGGAGFAPSDDPSHALYWKREVLSYQSGLLDNLPGGLTAPRCFGVEEQADGSMWLWLEHVADGAGPLWSLEQYNSAGQVLGRFNGAYLAGLPLPDYPWLTRPGSQRGLQEAFAWLPEVIADPATWEQPLLRRAFPLPLAERLLRLWADRHKLLDALDRLPPTLSHKDAFRRNLYFRREHAGDGRLTAIDWAYPGMGHAGLDPGDLAFASFSVGEVAPQLEPGELDRAVFDGYLDGLASAGAEVDFAQARFGYAAFGALKYGALTLWLLDAASPERYPVWERLSGLSMAEFLDRQARLVYYLLDLVDEARELLEEL